MDKLMWCWRARSRTKSTSRCLGTVHGVQWTFSIHSTYLLKSQSENKKLSWSVWIEINWLDITAFFLVQSQFSWTYSLTANIFYIVFIISAISTNIERRSQTSYTAPCHGIVSHGAPIEGAQFLPQPHASKKKFAHDLHAHACVSLMRHFTRVNPSSPKGGCKNPPNSFRPGAQNRAAKG